MLTSDDEAITNGRVTRSLRKRLTSVDSESSSRAGTPLPTKLISKNELNSPAKPSTRLTRRSSLCGTPVLLTPAKKVTRLDASEVYSPARRNTRLRSASVQEDDAGTQKNVTLLKTKQKFDLIGEEDNSLEESEESRRVTRSGSKSPLITQNNSESSATKTIANESVSSTRKRNSGTHKPGPKSKKKQFNLEFDEDDNNDGSVISDDKDGDASGKKEALEVKKRYTGENPTEKNQSDKDETTSQRQTPIKDAPENTDVIIIDDSTDCIENVTKDPKSPVLKLRKSQVVIENIVKIEQLSPNSMQCIRLNDPSSPTSPPKVENRLEKRKNVAFDDSSEDETNKNTYPKTPGSAKSRSLIELDSSTETEKSFHTGKEGPEPEESDCHNIRNEDEEHNIVSKTPYKANLSLHNVLSSTPLLTINLKNKPPIVRVTDEITENENVEDAINSETSKKSVSFASPEKVVIDNNLTQEVDSITAEGAAQSVDHEGEKSTSSAITNATDQNEKPTTKEPIFAKSWTQSVSGTVNDCGGKIDAIETEKHTFQQSRGELPQSKSPESPSIRARRKEVRRSRFQSDDDELDDNESGGDFQLTDDDREEEEYKRKRHIFIDGEAVEVDENYESGDSIDSDELQEILDNEVSQCGESLGSQDTEDEVNNDDDVADEDDQAFIVSDSEHSLLDYSESEITTTTPYNKREKACRRIKTVSESSDEVATGERNMECQSSAAFDDLKTNAPSLSMDVSKFIDESLSEEHKELNSSQKSEKRTKRKSLNQSKQTDDDLKQQSAQTLNRSKTTEESKDEKEEDEKSGTSRKSLNSSGISKANETNDKKSKCIRRSGRRSQVSDKDKDDEPLDESKSVSYMQNSAQKPDECNNKVEEQEEEALNTFRRSLASRRQSIHNNVQELQEDHSQLHNKKETGENNLNTSKKEIKRKSLIKQDKVEDEENRSNSILHQSVASARMDKLAVSEGEDESATVCKKNTTAYANSFSSDSDESDNQIKIKAMINQSNDTSSQDRGEEKNLNISQNKRNRKSRDSSCKLLRDQDSNDAGESSGEEKKNTSKTQNNSSDRRNSLNNSDLEKSFQDSFRNSLNKSVLEKLLEDSRSSNLTSSLSEEVKDALNPQNLFATTQHKKFFEQSPIKKTINIHDNEDDDPVNIFNISQKQRKSINKSNLDETSDQKSNAANEGEQSANKSLQRKSQSLRKPAVSAYKLPSSSSDTDDDVDELLDNIQKKVGFSISFDDGHQKKLKKKISNEEKLHRSFTFGGSRGVTTRQQKDVQSDFLQQRSEGNTSPSSAANTSVDDDDDGKTDQHQSDNSDAEKLQQISNVDTAPLGPIKPRHSIAVPMAHNSKQKQQPESDKKRLKRLSCVHGVAPNLSQSLIETIAERKHEMQQAKQKKLSKSFSVANDDRDNKLESMESQEKTKPDSATTTNLGKDTIQQILSRCDEILEAANRAKLESKKAYNKLKEKKPKTKIQEEKAAKKNKNRHKRQQQEPEAEEVVIVSPQEIKNKEPANQEIEKAVKASAELLLKQLKAERGTTKRPLHEDQHIKKKHHNEPIVFPKKDTTKRLPVDVLEAISKVESHPVIKKKKFNDSHAADDIQKPTKVHVVKSSAGDILEIPLQPEKKKKSQITKMKLSTGTVCIEPTTPVAQRQRSQSGFHESPITPKSLGFKVRNILTAGQDVPPVLPVSATKSKKSKHKQIIAEPIYSLPKPLWSQSGQFIEEELITPQLSSSSATQFYVSTLNSGRKKNKTSTKKSTYTPTNSSAINFKQNALFNENIRRETSREILQRKERKNVHNFY